MVHRFRQIVSSVLLVAFAITTSGGQALHEWLFHSHAGQSHAGQSHAGHSHCVAHAEAGHDEVAAEQDPSLHGHSHHGDDCPFHSHAAHSHAGHSHVGHSHDAPQPAHGERFESCCPTEIALDLHPGESAVGSSRGSHFHDHHDCLICLQFSQGQLISAPLAGLDTPAVAPCPVLEKTTSAGQAVRLAYLSRGPPVIVAA